MLAFDFSGGGWWQGRLPHHAVTVFAQEERAPGDLSRRCIEHTLITLGVIGLFLKESERIHEQQNRGVSCARYSIWHNNLAIHQFIDR